MSLVLGMSGLLHSLVPAANSNDSDSVLHVEGDCITALQIEVVLCFLYRLNGRSVILGVTITSRTEHRLSCDRLECGRCSTQCQCQRSDFTGCGSMSE